MEAAQFFWQLLHDSFLLTFSISIQFFGYLLIAGLLLFLLARFTRNLFAKTFGSRAEIYFTAWIGTPVHEMGHVIFCILFLHKIRKVTLFNPNSRDGSLGAVEHSYNTRNLYHQVGNFFIGAGPVIFGSLLIFLLSRWLLPLDSPFYQYGSPDLTVLSADGAYWVAFLHGLFHHFLSTVTALFSIENAGHWQFWLFLYLSLSISTHMELSPSDLRQMWSGLLVIIFLIFLFNLLYLWLFSAYVNILQTAVSYFSVLSQLLMTGLIFSFLNFLLTWIATIIFGILFRGKIPNPFTR
jgi:hypothetical protein